ncbi:MAG: carbamoyltransferase HypF [Eggerthellaceae bacterium]|nr:carbamoyltransferase HypF [Eggerthellaceae bacterium]
MQTALDIHVKGIVQGVGFRPFVFRLAKRHLLVGWVLNAVDGVHICAQGEEKLIDEFCMALMNEAPAAADVQEIEMHEIPLQNFTDFEIRFSEDMTDEHVTLVPPDMATCDECLEELFDPTNHRYHYPFINCTNCGPRFTIIESLPYDRAATTMSPFKMCDICEAEYRDPANRRFHAQPNACFSCGPALFAVRLNADASDVDAHVASAIDAAWARLPQVSDDRRIWAHNIEESDAIVEAAADVLTAGGIVAIKGLGGFHLACDAANERVVSTLRARKHRNNKAFALMAASLEDAQTLCNVSAAEADLLTSAARPIVLLQPRDNAKTHLAPSVTMGLSEVGIMLPTTPLQHLIARAFGGLLVMTSGNLHDEPIFINDEQAISGLSHIADMLVGNNRPIRTRFDDSVVRVISAGSAKEAVQMVRRARGYAPQPLRIMRNSAGEERAENATSQTPCEVYKQVSGAAALLACGGEQKATTCLVDGERAFVSQHIGDLEHISTLDAWHDATRTFQDLFSITPQIIACDMHPEYLSTKWAVQYAETHNVTLEYVQHHHAHIASIMGEYGLADAVIGVTFDGTGYGVDGAIWGGEILIANRSTFERFANFAYMPLPGGAQAIKHPARMAYGLLWQLDLLHHHAAKSLIDYLNESETETHILNAMLEQSLNTPYTSSMGRLLDALSALLGMCYHSTYEGEAAITLEAHAHAYAHNKGDNITQDIHTCADAFHIDIIKNTATVESTAHDTSVVLLDPAPLVSAVLNALEHGMPSEEIAYYIHCAIAQTIAQVCMLAHAAYGLSTVALGGGVFLNRLIVEQTTDLLEQAGFTVALPRELPPGDGAISYGQAVVACARHDETID